MRPGCEMQEWKRVESLSCTPKHCFTVALQSRASTGLWGSTQSAYDAGEGCMSTWVHIYTVCLRLHLYVSVSDVQKSECVCVCVYLGRRASYPSLTVWLDPVRIPMKQWVSQRQLRSPGPRAQPTGRPQPCLFKTRWKVRRDEAKKKKGEWTSNRFSCCEGDCGRTSCKIWSDHKWWWQIIVEAVWLGLCTRLKSDLQCLNS